MSNWELEKMLGWPAADGNDVTPAHRAFCAEHGHAPDHMRPPSPLCARCGELRAPITCPTCHGFKFIGDGPYTIGRACPECSGTGTIET